MFRCIFSSKHRHFSRFQFSTFDLAIIGGGPAGTYFWIILIGYNTAIRGAQKGLKTCIIDKGIHIGGTGLNYGSLAATSLLASTQAYFLAKNKFENYGLNITGLSYDMDQIMKNKDESISKVRKLIEEKFDNYHINYYHGIGKLLGKNEIEISQKNSDKKEIINATNIVLATGSELRRIPCLKLDEKIVISSYRALTMNKIPKKIIVVGAGAIGIEISSMFNHLGSEITLVEKSEKILPFCDSEISDYMRKLYTKRKYKIFTGHNVVSAQIHENNAKVIIENLASKNRAELEADCVLVAIGRQPFTKGLGCENVGLQVDGTGKILVNQELQTNVPNIYAIGDAIRGYLRESRAIEESFSVIDTILGNPTQVNYDLAPYGLHSMPAIGFIGHTEDALQNTCIFF